MTFKWFVFLIINIFLSFKIFIRNEKNVVESDKEITNFWIQHDIQHNSKIDPNRFWFAPERSMDAS